MAGFTCADAGFDGSPAAFFCGSAAAAPLITSIPATIGKDKRIALSIASARNRETSFRPTFAKWLKGKQEFAAFRDGHGKPL
jgi:hypothetical protein